MAVNIIEYKKRFSNYCHLEEIINNGLESWTKNKTCSKLDFETNYKNAINTLQKPVNNTKLASRIMVIAAIALAVLSLALTTSSIAFVIPPLFIASIVSWTILLTTTVSFIVTDTYNRRYSSKLDLVKSQDFKDFVQLTLVDKLKFIPNHVDLLDNKLHNLYNEWYKMKVKDINQFINAMK